MNIAILGGKFDPPHLWHFWTAEQILENMLEIGQVWYMPDNMNAFKQISAPASDRIKMLSYMETNRIRLSTLAVDKGSTTYTVDIVQELLHLEPGHRYYWIVGSDITAEFSKWREYQKLSHLIKFLVFPRKDYPIKSLPPNFYRVGENLLLSNISSSLVRDRIKRNLPIKGLVFPEVEDYIRKENLYK